MNLLKDKSSSIQLEAFHVFKIFIANPYKPINIIEILINNKIKLIKFLINFQNNNENQINNIQFIEEKRVIIETLEQLIVNRDEKSNSV